MNTYNFDSNSSNSNSSSVNNQSLFNFFCINNSKNNPSFLSLNLNILKDKSQLFILDTGADISLIKKSCIKNDVLCYPDVKCKIQRITKEHLSTIAAVDCNILLPYSKCLPFRFHIVPDDFPIHGAGIIGNDFIVNNKCLLDYESMTLKFKHQGILFTFDITKNNPVKNFKYKIPARSEKIIILPVFSENNAIFCHSQEINPGVFLANSVVRPINNEAIFSVLNINDYPVSFNDINIKFDDLNDYNVFILNNWSDNLKDRFKKLDSELDLALLNT